VRDDLPTGVVTFLFTDLEGSTRLLHELGAERYAEALAEHRRVIRAACAAEGGVEVDTQGDAFFFAFPNAPGAIAAAAAFTDALASGPTQVRVGLHTGTPLLTDEGYVGDDVHLAARVASSGHGGQVVLSQATAELVEFVLSDLGEHRLKDIAEAVSIYQLGSERFPPLKTISNTNLPRPASSFVGREKEVEDVSALLLDGARLLTLTGPGGSGKTRLALEAAVALLPEFKAGVFWVGLAPLRDPALVIDTVAHTLGAKNGLADNIGERELLLLLDNLEQVVEAAPELAALVEACPNLKLLVTSRELLRVRGEVEYPVLPLAEPDAVELFCARARAEPDEAVHQLCARLDSLPLAVELAAARASVLSPEQILERISGRLDLLRGGRDADPRQQTLRATIEWSYELLSREEQRLFARLSVFAGGCKLSAAEEIAGADVDTLQSLLDKSLLRHAEERYWMLETIREYAAEHLDLSGEAQELCRRHARHFLAFAEETEPYLRGRGSGAWLKRVDAEHDNLRAAMDELEAVGESQLVLRMAGALSRFWNFKGYLVEAGRRLEAALLADERPTAARAKALNSAALIAVGRGDVSRARLWGDEALTLHRQLGDAVGTARSTYILGGVAMEVPDWATARQLFDESLRAFVELEDEQGILSVTDTLALACYKLGDTERAWALAEDNLRRARAAGDEQWEATGLGALGFYAVADGRVCLALPLLVESTRKWRDWGELYWGEVGLNVCGFARAAAIAGNVEVAVQLLSAAASLNEQTGAAEESFVADLNEGTLVIIQSQLDEVAFAEAWEQGRTLTLDDAVALALDSLG
jgi:predicted ATPase